MFCGILQQKQQNDVIHSCRLEDRRNGTPFHCRQLILSHFVFYCFDFYKFEYIYHVVLGYYYIILVAILVRLSVCRKKV